ncbi:MAG: zinc ribbon domain-containing protein [Candidatus Riflebacteria bacterium]
MMPGRITGIVGESASFILKMDKAGRYLFNYRKSSGEATKGFVSVSPKFQNDVKIELFDAAGKKIVDNHYPEDRENGRKAYYGDYFSITLPGPGDFKLNFSPLSQAARATTFSLSVDFVPPPTMIAGMTLENFLAMIGTVLLLLGMLIFYRLIIKPMAGLNVAQVMQRGEELRQARKEAEGQVVAAATKETSDFCPVCGLPREPGATFCGECGAKVES